MGVMERRVAEVVKRARGGTDAEELSGRRSFVQDALALLGNRVLVMAISLLSGIVLARCLGPEGRGLIAAVMVYPSLFLSFTEMGVRQSTIYYLGRQIYTDRQVVGAVSTLILFTGALGMLLVGGWLSVAGNPAFTPLIIVLAVAPIPLTIVLDYSSGVFLGKRLVGQFAKVQRMAEVQRLTLVLMLVWFLGFGVPGALVASLLASTVVAGVALWKVSKIGPLRPSFEWVVIRGLLVKGLGYAVAVFVAVLNQRVAVALMERLSSSREIGMYTVALAFAGLIQTMPQTISSAIFSHAANAREPRAFSLKVMRLFRVTVVVSAFVMLGLVFLAPVMVLYMYGAKFAPSGQIVQLLLPGLFFTLAPWVLNMDLTGRGRPNLSLWITTPMLLLNIGLNLYLVPSYGAVGAAVASSVSYSLAGLAFMFMYCHVTAVRFGELWRFEPGDFQFLERFMPAGRLSRRSARRE
jgi:O-antigen/teichoic acid export membrane protein